jgi:hypothetical protein
MTLLLLLRMLALARKHACWRREGPMWGCGRISSYTRHQRSLLLFLKPQQFLLLEFLVLGMDTLLERLLFGLLLLLLWCLEVMRLVQSTSCFEGL